MDGRRRALIVAVDEYEHSGLRRLVSPAADAAALADVLSNPRIGGYEVEVVRNESAHDIQERIEDFFVDARGEDLLLVHFSCHGLKSEAGELHFAARNTRPNRLASTAIPADFVQRCMRTSRSRSIVLLLDCCYGGAFGQGVAVRAAGDVNVLDSFPKGRLGGGRGRAVITSSSAMEYAFEGDQLADNQITQPSPFTSALVEGLATGDADRDEDGWVSLNELYDYVFDRVRQRSPNQTPSRDIELEGELYLARSGRQRIRPAPVPTDLQAAIEDGNPYTRLGAVMELRSRLASSDLPVAAGAHEALSVMATRDTRLVAESAAAVLAQAAVTVSPLALEFRTNSLDRSPPSMRIELSGPPLARKLNVTVSDPWIHVDGRGGGYDVSIVPQRPGRMIGNITFTGLTGQVVVTVSIEVAAPTPRPERKEIKAEEMRPPPAPPQPTLATLPLASSAETATRPTPAIPPDVGGETHNRSRAVAGALAGLGAVAVVVEISDRRLQGLYLVGALLHLGILLAASFSLLVPRTRRDIGPGLLLGAGAGACWALLIEIAGLILLDNPPPLTYYAPILLSDLLALVACVIVWRAVAQEGHKRWHLRLPRGRSGPFLLGAAVAGPVGLAMVASGLFLNFDHLRPYGLYFLAGILPAFMVPMAVASELPVRLRIGLAIGWVTSALAVLQPQTYLLSLSFGVWAKGGVLFGLSLLALLLAIPFVIRRSEVSRSQQE